VVDIAVGVVLGENLQGLVVLVLGHQETRRLRNKPDENDLDDRGESLNQSGDAPGPVVADVVGAKGEPGNRCKGSQLPGSQNTVAVMAWRLGKDLLRAPTFHRQL
jgi:hypothetical protein